MISPVALVSLVWQLARTQLQQECSFRYAARCRGRKSRSRETALRRPQEPRNSRRLPTAPSVVWWVGAQLVSWQSASGTMAPPHFAGPLRCDAFGQPLFRARSRSRSSSASCDRPPARDIRLKRSWLAFGVWKRRRYLVNNGRRRGICLCDAGRSLKHGHYVVPSPSQTARIAIVWTRDGIRRRIGGAILHPTHSQPTP